MRSYLEQCAAVHAALAEYAPFIGGGVARDAIFGRPVKDIDVFLPWIGKSKAAFDEVFVASAARMGGSIGNAQGAMSFGDPDDEVSDVIAQGVIEFADGRLPVNMIALKLPDDEAAMLARFDIDLCRCYYDPGTERMKVTWSAQDAFDRKCMTIVRSSDVVEFDRSVRRFERLVEKYPGFKLGVAPNLQPLASASLEWTMLVLDTSIDVIADPCPHSSATSTAP